MNAPFFILFCLPTVICQKHVRLIEAQNNPLQRTILRQLDKLDTKFTEVQKLRDRNKDELQQLKIKLCKISDKPDEVSKGSTNTTDGHKIGLENLVEVKNRVDDLQANSKKQDEQIDIFRKKLDILTANVDDMKGEKHKCSCQKEVDIVTSELKKLDAKFSNQENILDDTIRKLNALQMTVNKTIEINTNLPLQQNGTKDPKQVLCQSGSKLFNDHCYYFIEEIVTWQTAKAKCENLGAYLVKIENEAENIWIKSMLKGKTHLTWTGLNYVAKEGIWRWTSDNSQVEFQDWYPGEPNNFAGPEAACGEFYGASFDFRWDDTYCSNWFSGVKGYICEKWYVISQV